MVRLYLFAEGQTEQTFAASVLAPHLERKGVCLQNPVLIAHARKQGKTLRGGGQNYAAMKDDILRFLSQENGNDVFFTTMIDLYAIHPGFPGLLKSQKIRLQPLKRVEFLEHSFADDIGDHRFVPYIQLHEFEAYLFSDTKWFGYFYESHEKQIAALQAIADEYPTPELIDDGPHSAPSKRIIAQLPDYKDAKSAIGPQIAQLIGLDVIRSKCPHFSNWITKLENLDQKFQ